MSNIQRLERLFEEILKEVHQNPDFANRLASALDQTRETESSSGGDRKTRTRRRPKSSTRRRGSPRRQPGAFDPFAVFQEEPDALRSRLQSLNIEQLKDIVAEHGMDQAKLAMKWKKPERLIDLIAETVRDRMRKGNAFRNE